MTVVQFCRFRSAIAEGRGFGFLFSGQGAMGTLSGTGFVDRQEEILLGLDDQYRLRTGGDLLAPLHDETLARSTEATHPLLFALQYSAFLAASAEGILPTAVCGSSLGEFVALAVAGCADPMDLLELVASQGRQFARLCPAGGMVALLVPPDSPAVARILSADISVAVGVPESHLVVSGGFEALARLVERARDCGILTHHLPVEHAFHSPLLDPAREAFLASVADISWSRPTLPLVSCVTGGVVDRVDPEALWLIARGPIRLERALLSLAGRVGSLVDFGASRFMRNTANHILRNAPVEVFSISDGLGFAPPLSKRMEFR